MEVTIDPDAGFCFGVERAIQIADTELVEKKSLYCLGDIVHNHAEVTRLGAAGLNIISANDLAKLSGKRVLLRAHGEPPSTYELAKKLGVELIDATCPIVSRLQQKIRQTYLDGKDAGLQILIFGKPGHPEVVGLSGQTDNTAIIVHRPEDLETVDFGKPIRLFCQTTMSFEAYESMTGLIQDNMKKAGNPDFVVQKSFCRQVSGRTKTLKEFALSNDVIIFASDKKSSNGEFLFNVCRSVNGMSYFVHDTSELKSAWFKDVDSVGVTGATSTPKWLMEKIATVIEAMEIED